jgi:pimeloyl-ACP methyl ester carboxylesterase
VATVVANGVALNVLRLPGPTPAGPPVVMLHGIVIDNLSSFFYTLAHPVAATNPVVLYDLRGHGRSERPATGYRMADHVADLDGLLGGLGITEPVVLLGNSVGGGIAVSYALAHPDRVAGLVLVEAHVPAPGGAEGMAGMLRRIGTLARQGLDLEPQLRRDRRVDRASLPALEELGLGEEQIAFVLWWIEHSPARKVLTMARTADGLVNGTTLVDDMASEPPIDDAALAQVTCPTLLVYGERSDIVDRAPRLARLMPRAELTVLPGWGHSVLMEGIDALRPLVVPWVAGLVAGV